MRILLEGDDIGSYVVQHFGIDPKNTCRIQIEMARVDLLDVFAYCFGPCSYARHIAMHKHGEKAAQCCSSPKP